MKKLELELFRYDTLIFGKVLHQDEELRKSEKICSEDDFTIISSACPELRINKLFVKGVNWRIDNKPFFYDYASEEEAKSVVEKIKKLVDKINGETKESTKVIKEI